MVEERTVVAGHELVLLRPEDPERLIDEDRFATDEFMPYWAELWPSGVALAGYVARLDVHGRRVLELGCGLALPTFAAALGGADVLASDWAPEALELVARNAAGNGIAVRTAPHDWHAAAGLEGERRFDLVLAADVLYEERNAAPLLTTLAAVLADHGAALVADPGRRHAPAFFDAARAAGWSVAHHATDVLPAGSIATLRRR
jgi:predicted nicotinamide N-methyase